MASKCTGCGKFTSATDGVKCRKCSHVFHRGCLTNLSPNNTSAPKLVCKSCRNNTNDIFEDANSLGGVEAMMKAIDLLRTELSACTQEIASFRQEMCTIRSSVAEFNRRLDDFDERITKIENGKKIDTTDGDIIAQLREDLNERDQELLQNDIEITGITELNGENLLQIVNLVASKLGVNIEDRDVVSVQRAGPRRATASSELPRARAICVRLARRTLRDEFLQAARVRRGADTTGFNIDTQPRRFYVNERLTRVNRSLFYAARAKAKEAGWRYVWTRDGRIFTRRAAGDKIKHRIKCSHDVDEVFQS